ncbi:MAG: hypothetical protein H0V82_07850 [Candidatus Protochlamydia sp.]|nr:hypothetical protein [Candidatus Protochlamydia sp.]
MAQKSRINKTFSPYYQDSPLLIQFIITEFLLIHQITDPIKNHIQNLQPSTNWEESIQIFYRLLNELIGNPLICQYIPNTSWHEGPLTKMKNYSEHLSHHVPFLDTHLHLQTSVYKAWISAIHILELIKAFHLHTTVPKNFSLKKHFELSLNKFLIRLSRMTKEIPKNANLFWDDENVAYFLIRKKKALTQIFGEHELIKQFKSFGKQGALLPLLIQKFQARGFDYFDLKHAEAHD